MATPIYATGADYAAWTGVAAPSNITQILRSASLAVREATEGAFYAADPATGLPLDATVLKAFNDATCCQASALVALGYDPATGGTITAGVKESKQLGTARITYAASDVQAAAQAKQQAITGLVVDAQRILRNAGLLKAVPWVVG